MTCQEEMEQGRRARDHDQAGAEETVIVPTHPPRTVHNKCPNPETNNREKGMEVIRGVTTADYD